MKQFILLVLISAALNPISICAQETDTHDEADSSASPASDHSSITADNPGVSKVALDILTRMTEFISSAQGYTTVVIMGNEIVFTFHGVDTKHASGTFRIWVNVLCRTDLDNPRYFERHFFGCFETYASVTGAPLSSIHIWECEEVAEWKKDSGLDE